MKRFKWKGKKIQVEPITESYPIDIQQVPDIFIHLYTKTFLGRKRIGYVRVAANDPTMSQSLAYWYTVKDPQNNFEGRSPGILLANLRLMQGDSVKAPRQTIRYDSETILNFYAFAYSAMELCPELDSHEVRARIDFTFCDLRPNENQFHEEKKERKKLSEQSVKKMIDEGAMGDSEMVSRRPSEHKEKKPGEREKKVKHSMIIESEHKTRNPIFGLNQKGEIIMAQAKITGGLAMAPSIIVNVYNCEKNAFNKLIKNDKPELIGSCYISPAQCQIVKGASGELNNVEPQFYTIQGPDGTNQGKILLFICFSKNLKESISESEFKKAFKLKMKKFKLDFSCIGLRNLDTSCPAPELTLRIPSYRLLIKFDPCKSQSEYETKLKALSDTKKPLEKKDDQEDPSATEQALGQTIPYLVDEQDTVRIISGLKDSNPNICCTSGVSELYMPAKPLFWPRAEIEAKYTNILRLETKYFTTVDLVDYCEGYSKSQSDLLKEKIGMKRKGGDAGDGEEAPEEYGKHEMNHLVE